MNTNQILLAYPESDTDIRTIYRDEDVYFCLIDVVRILAHQNSTLAQESKSQGLMGLVSAQIEVLEKDEVETFEGKDYVTQPGLFRIILRDNSPACKRFQKWVLGEVLPSIQKYGTYPPPIVKQGSDVRRVVEGLLMEIEQREELERQTKEQFRRHEKILNNLGEQLETLKEGATKDIEFISIPDYIAKNGIDSTHEQFIFGYCIKIVSENSEPVSKSIRNGVEEKLFPPHVIAQAYSEVIASHERREKLDKIEV